MTITQQGKALRKEFESVNWVNPSCPRPRAAYSALSASLYCYKIGLPISDPGVKDPFIQDEFNRLQCLISMSAALLQSAMAMALNVYLKFLFPNWRNESLQAA